MNSPVTPVSRPVRAAKRKAPKPTLDALAAEFEQNPQMAEALANARREFGGLVGDGPGSFRGLRLGAGLSQAGLAARTGRQKKPRRTHAVLPKRHTTQQAHFTSQKPEKTALAAQKSASKLTITVNQPLR